MPTKEDYIYAAGIVDGEGQVTIDKSVRPRMINPSYSVYVKVYNTNPVLTDHFFKKFGGSTGCEASKNPHHKDEYQWTLYGNAAKDFLIKVLPFLKLKCKQAQLCIELQEIINSSRINKNNKHLRDDLYSQIRSLNQRGK